MTLYLGGPIWSYRGWLGELYPPDAKPSEFLRAYAQRLNTVEGNTTFYAVPSPETVARWAEETPESFRFCPKIPRAISHAGPLVEHLEEAADFVAVMQGLGERLGPIFLQLPPRFGPAMGADLARFLEAWPAEVRLAVEVRHPDWFDGEPHRALSDLLAEHNAARVVFDTRPIRDLSGDPILEGSVYQRMLEARERKPDVPVAAPAGPFVFLRYIGHPQLGANQPFIENWAQELALWIEAGRDVFVFCHCPDEGQDPALCRMFHRVLGELTPILPLPWDDPERAIPKQGRLF